MKAEIILYGGETYLKSQEKKCLCNQSSFRVSFGYSLHVSDNLHLWRREMRENTVEGERREGGCIDYGENKLRERSKVGFRRSSHGRWIPETKNGRAVVTAFAARNVT